MYANYIGLGMAVSSVSIKNQHCKTWKFLYNTKEYRYIKVGK
jgi:hypothetical protein